MQIKIYKNCLSDSHSIYMNDEKSKYVTMDRKETSYSVERFKFIVMDMIIGWENKLNEPNIIDGLEYKIVIKENNKDKEFHFINKFPADIIRLEKLIQNVLAVKNVR